MLCKSILCIHPCFVIICHATSQINADAKDNRGGQTALFIAAKEKNAEAVKLLLENGASLTEVVHGQSVKEVIRVNLPYFDVAAVKVKARPRANTVEYLMEMLERRDLAYFK